MLAIAVATTADAASTASRYAQTLVESQLDATPVTLLSTTIELARPTWVYLQSDGVLAPGGSARASVAIQIDGQPASNVAAVDWRRSLAPQPHTYSVIGARLLPAGRTRIDLRASASGASARVPAGANLSVLVDPAERVTEQVLARDTAALAFDTAGSPERSPLRDGGHAAVLSQDAGTAGGPLVAMAAASVTLAAEDYGDAMLGIFVNGRQPPVDAMTWSINDLWLGAETEAPMFSQALVMAPPVPGVVQLVASESPYFQPVNASTNGVRYSVGRGARLITLRGGMRVVGRALAPHFDYRDDGRHRRYAYVCIGSNGFKPTCPKTATSVTLAEGAICIPPGHGGVVLMAAKSRVQGDDHDAGGTVTLQLMLDGQPVGSRGLQVIGPQPHSVSTRTIGASYLAAGEQRLDTGCHSVRAVGKASGDFRNLSMNADVPLLWFD